VDPLRVAGVPETALPAEVAATLPPTPAPPWVCRVSGVVWVQRATAAAAGVLPAAVRRRTAVPLTIAAFLRYADTPVGAYSEVVAAPVVFRRGPGRVHVPFLAVDSVPSVSGGREHWGLPKGYATFDWTDAGDAAGASGDGWALSVRATPGPVRLPLWGRGSIVQVTPDGALAVAPVRLRGHGRPARVQVECSADASFAAWLSAGSRVGLVLDRARLVVGPAALRA